MGDSPDVMSQKTMTDSHTSTEISDAELVLRTRSGDTEAFGELWTRHYRSGMTVARSVTSRVEPEDLVQESYARIFQAIRKGGGPNGAFRAYLFTSIRNTAASWGRTPRETTLDELDTVVDPTTTTQAADDALDRSLTAQAFRSLPSRWQEVLWYTEIEGMKPAAVGALVGMSAGAVSQLAFRAREGLREAWIQAHLRAVEDGSECQWLIESLGSYARGNLSVRDRKRVAAHLDECTRCMIVAAEANDVSSRLALVLLPLVLGVSGAGAYLAALQNGTTEVVALAAMPSTLVEGGVSGAVFAGGSAPGGGSGAAGGAGAGGSAAGGASAGTLSGIGVLVGSGAAALVVAGAVSAAVIIPGLGGSGTPALSQAAAPRAPLTTEVAADHDIEQVVRSDPDAGSAPIAPPPATETAQRRTVTVPSAPEPQPQPAPDESTVPDDSSPAPGGPENPGEGGTAPEEPQTPEVPAPGPEAPVDPDTEELGTADPDTPSTQPETDPAESSDEEPDTTPAGSSDEKPASDEDPAATDDTQGEVEPDPVIDEPAAFAPITWSPATVSNDVLTMTLAVPLHGTPGATVHGRITGLLGNGTVTLDASGNGTIHLRTTVVQALRNATVTFRYAGDDDGSTSVRTTIRELDRR